MSSKARSSVSSGPNRSTDGLHPLSSPSPERFGVWGEVFERSSCRQARSPPLSPPPAGCRGGILTRSPRADRTRAGRYALTVCLSRKASSHATREVCMKGFLVRTGHRTVLRSGSSSRSYRSSRALPGTIEVFGFPGRT